MLMENLSKLQCTGLKKDPAQVCDFEGTIASKLIIKIYGVPLLLFFLNCVNNTLATAIAEPKCCNTMLFYGELMIKSAILVSLIISTVVIPQFA